MIRKRDSPLLGGSTLKKISPKTIKDWFLIEILKFVVVDTFKQGCQKTKKRKYFLIAIIDCQEKIKYNYLPFVSSESFLAQCLRYYCVTKKNGTFFVIYRRLSRSRQLERLVPVFWLGVPPRYKARQAKDPSVDKRKKHLFDEV